ncbi:hypothetical protein QBC35DRAFT_526971 [Podospora australis]|uniref:Ecp2 effector protein domain-containing protein n=1 Tax=Podospora australis TaxID=1536484 RepID=A0AAN6X4Y1_9PEZI|nr:hypothetical protein QBC35DRAFT_526971 [Podospora australis]
MKFTIATVAAALAGLAIASPAAAPAPTEDAVPVPANLAKRQSNPSVYVTQHINWGTGAGGYKDNIFVINNDCTDLWSPYIGSISSFGPNAGVRCDLYQSTGCTGTQLLNVRSPGYGDLRNIGGVDWNDKIRSIRCRWI